jgi:hypothetical protein
MRPALVMHADWSVRPRKRWMAVASLRSDGGYHATAPEAVGDPATLVERMRAAGGANEAALLGVDFPLGIPHAYAERAGISAWRDFLTALDGEAGREFFAVATRREEISLRRPFYPQRPGGTRPAHLLAGLDVATLDDLRRRCERGDPSRRAAAPLFWTLGGQQVGKAAISGWRDVIVPALREAAHAIALWPFDGELDELLRPGRVVLAETYPAECYRHLGVTFVATPGQRGGKRVRAARRANAAALFDWAAAVGVGLSAALRAQLGDGFGERADGEDRFDAVVGLFGMLNVVLGRRSPGAPPDLRTRRIEGWILGQQPRA